MSFRRVMPVLLLIISVTGTAVAEDSPLIEAARQGETESVRQLLAEGVDPNVRQADGATAAHWATYRGNAGMLAALVEAGADVTLVNRLGASPLFVAVESGNAKLIQQLLESGANPNSALKLGETPLMTAARVGSVEGVRLLIAAGADVNVREQSREQTALMWAATQGHVDVARLLIEAGAELDARSAIRPRLMFAEASNGGAFDQGIIEQLGGFSALLFAAQQGHTEMAATLITAGADIDGAAGNGASPLVIATHSGHTELVKQLLESGADPNAIGAGYNALHAAVLRGDLEAVLALLDRGADPDVRLQRPTPIQRASEDWAFKTSDVSATPYLLAASYREPEIMRVLEQAGADPLLTTEEQWSRPRERADRSDDWVPKVVGGFESAVQIAIKGASDRGRFYVIATDDPIGEERLALEAVKVAAEHGINLNHADFTKSTALHDAATRNLATVVRALAESGADVNALDGRGRTPLDYAIASAGRTLFYAPDQPVPDGPTTVEVLESFGAVRSQVKTQGQ